MLKLSLRPSRRLAVLLVLAHLAAAGAALVVEIPVALKIALTLLVSASCAASLYGPALLRSDEAIVGLEIGEGTGLSFQTRRGEWREGTLSGSSFVAPYLVVLNVRAPGRRFARHVVIMPDSIDAEDFRRLRVRLWWRIRPETS